MAEFANASGVGAAASAGGNAGGAPHGASGGACSAISFRTGARQSAGRQEKQGQACRGQKKSVSGADSWPYCKLPACGFMSSRTWLPSVLFLLITIGF